MERDRVAVDEHLELAAVTCGGGACRADRIVDQVGYGGSTYG